MKQSITNVRGISCWGAHIGIKSNRRDLAIIRSSVPASASAVFTQNLVTAEPIKLCRSHLDDGVLQAFVINSGNANACTGEAGYKAAESMLNCASDALQIAPENILISSTGIIGEPFPIDKVNEGIQRYTPKLSTRAMAGALAANAILTTDTFAKEGFSSFSSGGTKVNLAGIAKGSGMIHPNMGTMLAYLLCDIDIAPALLDKALRKAVDASFNMITVDGDTSTNDTVAIMCNGLAGNTRIEKEDAAYEQFYTELLKLCTHLAKLVVSDGEGATKMIEYHVEHAPSEADARQLVRTISDSNLVKTAMFGQDPNWGRIIAAAGRSGVVFDPEKIALSFGFDPSILIVEKGQPVMHNRAALKKLMGESQLRISLDLNMGKAESTGWGSDLSYDYVRINAEYTT